MMILLTFDTQGDIDAAIPGLGTRTWPGGHINFCDLTMRRYDIPEGLPRILRLLDRHEVKATFACPGLTAEWFPNAVKEIQGRGHEVAVHGHRHVPMFELSEDEQRREIEQATMAVAAVIGRQPQGWRTPIYTNTEHTLDQLRDFGYIWNSDFHDAEFPYVLDKDGRLIVEIPAGHDDYSQWILDPGPGAFFPQMGGTPYGTPDGVYATMKAEFDVLYAESAESPRVMQWCMHPSVTGRPSRAAVLDRLIEYMKGHDGVRLTTCEYVASLA
jgi:peptidoglycan/xylan/chitin deacetylase (PgdA/CDA1 family)